MTTINRDEWLSALKDAGLNTPDPDPTAVTAAEFGKAFSLKQSTARGRLERLVDVGKAVRVTKAEQDSHGRTYAVTAYRLLA